MSGKRTSMRWTNTGLAAPESDSVRVVRESDVDVLFQPIVDVRTGITFAHEALARCKLPKFLSPVTLFEQAAKEEACGRLGRVVRNVLFEHCSRKRIFINVHPQEVSQRWLVQPTDPLLLHESEVFIEVTESAAFDYFDVCLSVLSEIKARCNAKIVVDDFGAGHADLERVLALHPDMVKLDMLLVRDLHLDLERQDHVRHIIDTCHSLGAEVVAEGIETQAELDVIIALGADYGQGYYLGRPAFPPSPAIWPSSLSMERRLDVSVSKLPGIG
jgi:EAL domain-containing protein (putative c-di-GMP-specific phosphodiesterase class I)